VKVNETTSEEQKNILGIRSQNKAISDYAAAGHNTREGASIQESGDRMEEEAKPVSSIQESGHNTERSGTSK
jgi:hypothetical protein